MDHQEAMNRQPSSIHTYSFVLRNGLFIYSFPTTFAETLPWPNQKVERPPSSLVGSLLLIEVRHFADLRLGAGVGGVSTAAYLAEAGFEVKVFEKNDYSGGRCSILEWEKYVRLPRPQQFLLMQRLRRL